jgi:hypothetical protein
VILLLLWVGREVMRARQRERDRREPGGFDTALAWAATAVLVILGMTISWTLFWIGLFIVAPIVIAVALSE